MSDSASKPPVIELRDVAKAFPDPKTRALLPVVQGFSLSVPDQEAGEFIVLLGPSGCGKSTILNMVSGLIPPDSGDVSVFGRTVDGPAPDCITVPQAYTCFPWLSALRNVEFGLSILGQPKDERRQRATEYLERVGLGDRLDARPKELSGGMQQRVAIARALAMRKPVVLMDEPFGALDAQTRAEMQRLLVQLWQEEKNLILFITHDITEALLLADRIIVLSARPARTIYDLRVPFPRPRNASICQEPQFLELSEALLKLLRREPNSGQVRVTV